MATRSPEGRVSPLVRNLDVLRLVAIVLITMQHALSVIGRYDMTKVGDGTVGQYGVGLFCVISGFLAFRDTRPPLVWLKRRLRRVFPSYWLVMAVSFVLTGVYHRKHFDAVQVICQMAGIGFFTHGWNLVNVVSWFISLILLCYAIAFGARLVGRSTPILLVAASVAATLMVNHVETSMSRHVVAFCVAGLAGGAACGFTYPVLAAGAVALYSLQPLVGQFSYAALSVSGLLLCLALPTVSRPLSRKMGSYVYEYFLVHGLILVGAVTLIPNARFVAIFLGVVTSALVAPVLQWFTERLVIAAAEWRAGKPIRVRTPME